MKVLTLNPDRIARFLGPLIAAALLGASPSLAPAQAEQVPKVGYLGSGSAMPPCDGYSRYMPLAIRPERHVANSISTDAQSGMVVEASPTSSLEVPEPELLFEFLVVPLDAPAQLRERD